MAETAVEEKPAVVATPETKSPVTEAKPAAQAPGDKPVTTDDKSKPATETKTETKVETPAEELKTLLDEAGEEKPEDGKTIEKTVPEKYEFKLPEGMTLDEASMAIVSPIFKELGLDNASAQKLVDLQSQLTKANEDAHASQFTQYVEGLKKESKEYFGTKLPEVMRNMARVRDTFMPKSADGKDHPLLDKLNVSGLANDKHVIELFDKIGRVIGEGKFVEGKRSAPAKGDGSVETTGPSLKDVYPSMTTK